LNKALCATVHYCLFISNFSGVGYKIYHLLNPKTLGTEVDSLSGVYCIFV